MAPDRRPATPLLGIAFATGIASCGLFYALSIAVASAEAVRPTGAIVGRVVEDLTSVGVPEAVVSVIDGKGQRLAKLTDDAGLFAFADVDAGTYTLTVQKPGYWQGTYGQRRPNGGGRRFVLAPGAPQHPQLVLSVWRIGSISGHVRTESGQPLRGQRVEAMRKGERVGRLAYDVTNAAVSDDTGAYSISGLFPDEYIVRIAATQLNDRIAGATYYAAGVRPSGAVPVRVAPGEDLTNVDVQRRPSESRVLRGRLKDSGGAPVSGVEVQLVTDAPELTFGEVLGSVKTSADGAFQFHVEPGNYIVRALAKDEGPTRPGGSLSARGLSPTQGPARIGAVSRWATSSVSVSMQDADPDVTLSLRSSTSIRGRVAISEVPSLPADLLRRVRLFLAVPDGRQNVDVSIRADSEGNFEATGLPGGQYFVRAGVPRGWYIERVVAGGRDVSAEPLNVEADVPDILVQITAATATITGSVLSAKGEKDETATVLIFPADARRRQDTGIDSPWFREVRVSETGAFDASGLASGTYVVVAVADEATSNWRADSRLVALSNLGTRVMLTRGETVTVNLVAHTNR